MFNYLSQQHIFVTFPHFAIFLLTTFKLPDFSGFRSWWPQALKLKLRMFHNVTESPVFHSLQTAPSSVTNYHSSAALHHHHQQQHTAVWLVYSGQSRIAAAAELSHVTTYNFYA